jgi:hypothetical protein
MLPSGNSSAAATPRRNSVSSLTLFGSGMENLRFIATKLRGTQLFDPSTEAVGLAGATHHRVSPRRFPAAQRIFAIGRCGRGRFRH